MLRWTGGDAWDPAFLLGSGGESRLLNIWSLLSAADRLLGRASRPLALDHVLVREAFPKISIIASFDPPPDPIPPSSERPIVQPSGAEVRDAAR